MNPNFSEIPQKPSKKDDRRLQERLDGIDFPKPGVTFEGFAKSQKIELLPWQKEAAAAFLKIVHEHRHGPSGKTTLINLLAEFLNHHGNEFNI